ncbi:MAG: sigma 54-interacting transcriptional regulator [Deltaproteobacteria bacterium]|nr:sigma 54-interacting transcriptional regulator [Deltaproteobacteria bacterium]
MGEQDTTATVAPPQVPRQLTWTLLVAFTGGRCPAPAPLRLLGKPCTIGRSSECPVALVHDPRVSRRHATIRVGADGASIADCSANGTFINGRAIDTCALADGDVVRVGDSFLVLRRRGPIGDESEPETELLGASPAMEELRRTVALVGPTKISVLIVGETGTGKELVARALHAAYRPAGPFVPVNCSAIPDGLAEAALFGHCRGAFSGADRDQPGYFRDAEGGVLFLDEVGELPPNIQPKLLRALEDMHVIPVGTTRPVACDVRVVAATNRDLRTALPGGSFRGDLYARLAELTITTPALRERREDVLPILCRALGETAPALAPDLVDALLRHDWPFNVRELVKLASELRLRGSGLPALDLDLVRHRLQPPATLESGGLRLALPAGAKPGKDELVALLRRHRGVVADVARATDRSRKQIYRWIEGYGIDLAAFREGND